MPLVIIAHRGNLDLINPKEENHPDYIFEAIQQGFPVEVDIRYINKKWFLGHDNPDYKVSIDWIKKMSGSIYWHAKNQDAFLELNKFDSNSYWYWKYFWQQNDDYCLTSTGHIWTHCSKPAKGKNSIATLLGKGLEVPKGIFGICTDYPLDYRQKGL